MTTVVVIGGGWSGCAAAYAAARQGRQVILLEKNDRLLGFGLVAGEIYSNGRLTVSLEVSAMGGHEFFQTIEQAARHRNIPLPGAENTVVYDVLEIEAKIRRLLEACGVDIRMQTRAVRVDHADGNVRAVILANTDAIAGDSFVECTGSAGPLSLCTKHGWGCVICMNRCPIFGGRVSMVAQMGLPEKMAERRNGGFGAVGQGVTLLKSSLDAGLVRQLERDGILLIPVSEDFSPQRFDVPKGDKKTLRENLALVDNGFVKIKSRPFIPIERLRSVKGFENAVFFDPVGGSKGNCIRFLAATPRDNRLLADGTRNVFVAGEKQGLLVGVCEAIATGLVAGGNAARLAAEIEPALIPRSTAVGEMIHFTRDRLAEPSGTQTLSSCLGGDLFQALRDKRLYTANPEIVAARVQAAGLAKLF